MIFIKFNQINTKYINIMIHKIDSDNNINNEIAAKLGEGISKLINLKTLNLNIM